LLKETPDHKAGALLAVVFDRLIGLVALVAITVSLVTLRFDLLWRTPVTVESGFTPHQLLGRARRSTRRSISGLVASFIISGFNLFQCRREHSRDQDNEKAEGTDQLGSSRP